MPGSMSGSFTWEKGEDRDSWVERAQMVGGGKDEECAWGGREGTGGPSPRGCVQEEKLAERRNHSERQEGT